MYGWAADWLVRHAALKTDRPTLYLPPSPGPTGLAAIAFAECNRAGNGMRKVTSAFPRMGWMEGRARQWAGLRREQTTPAKECTLDPPRPAGPSAAQSPSPLFQRAASSPHANVL